ncbi:hypothetical protein FPH17_09200 [Corynebacterium godavarianum]|uniref:Uncharacterized protein n=1 Tax=Corynebacterium godavarianum TaxID=2054421 RepID=A0ABY3DZP1_9CORY|nr:hypothetical protein [Corynebacterium godavarianum]MBL7284703.1 hypothetical protein [Corynebacterium godavarianum]TSJ72814.1 hypothetical protein FPH17_09200 [Corynebacterium godavarianum]
MKKRYLAALCAFSVASSIFVAPAAQAKYVSADGWPEPGRQRCIVRLDTAERELTQEYFAMKIEEQTKLQNQMRSDFPQYQDLFDAWDNYHKAQKIDTVMDLPISLDDLEAKGYKLYDQKYMFFTNSDVAAELEDWAKFGYPYEFEVGRNWSPGEMHLYPHTRRPVIFGKDGENFTHAQDTYRELPYVCAALVMIVSGFLGRKSVEEV